MGFNDQYGSIAKFSAVPGDDMSGHVLNAVIDGDIGACEMVFDPICTQGEEHPFFTDRSFYDPNDRQPKLADYAALAGQLLSASAKKF